MMYSPLVSAVELDSFCNDDIPRRIGTVFELLTGRFLESKQLIQYFYQAVCGWEFKEN